jgi:twitching motility protein PilT
MSLEELLYSMVDKKASDLHFKAGAPPLFRIDGDLVPQSENPLTAEEVMEAASSLMDEKQRRLFFEDRREVDLAYALEGVARYRTNILWQRGKPEVIMRLIPQHIPRIEDINLPTTVLKQIAAESRGLILVTGITGSGKSTTLAALINEMNTNRQSHIVTVEDPIEFVHPDKSSSVTQREVGLDTETFKTALKYVLRQDPDIILIGEMRDVETVQAAITAAETGHLVLSTLHTMDTIQTMERILDFFPPNQQNQVRVQLSNTLRAVISQRLVQRAGGVGVVPAAEIMIVTPTIKSLIADNKITSIRQFIAEGQSQYGMQTFDQSLISLVRGNLITKEAAMEEATSPSEIELGLKGISSSRASAQSLISQMENQQQKERMGGWLKRAQDLFQRNRYEDARGELKRVLQEMPDHKEANELMARIREVDAKSEKKKDAGSNIRAGLAHFREGRYQAAILEFQKALEIDPANKQAQNSLQTIQDKMAAMETARGFLQAATEAQQRGDWNAVLSSVTQALGADPSNERAQELQRQAKAQLEAAKTKAKAEDWSRTAIEQYKAGDLLGALVSWSRAFELNSDLEEVSRYIQQGTARLLSFGVDGLEGNPEKDNVLKLFEQGVRCYIRSDFQTAIEFFRKAYGKADGNAYLTAYLQKSTQMLEAQIQEIYQDGLLAHRGGDMATALKQYNKVLRLSPGHPDTVQRLAELKVSIQEETERIYNEGKDQFDKNQMDAAILTWGRILELDPANERARKRIEEAKAKKNILSDIYSKIE